MGNQLALMTGCACTFLLFLEGCVTYPAVARFQDFNEVLYGKVDANVFTGGGTFSLEGKVTGLSCQGNANLTYIPNPMSCRGQGGELFASCSDGRTITGEWNGQTCTKGFGRGIDSGGNTFAFTFGMSEQEASAQLDMALASAAAKPALKTYDPRKTRLEKGYSTGTGFFVSTAGHMITNYHVIESADEILVRMRNGVELTASLITSDAANDLALIKVDAETSAIAVSTSARLAKGSDVMTLGFPLVGLQGQEQKATFGRINALSGLSNDIRLIQIDVPVQPGNSGGPLIGRNGSVIGVVTATLNQINALKESGALPQNVNYAVKSDYILPILASAGIMTREVSGEFSFEELVRNLEPAVAFVITK